MSCRWNGSTSNHLQRTTDLLNVNSVYTAMAWIQLVNPPGMNSYANAWYFGRNSSSLHSDSLQFHDVSGTLHVNLWVSGYEVSELEGSVVTSGTWYHCAVVRTGIAECLVYLNGTLDITNTASVITRAAPDIMALGVWHANTLGDPPDSRMAGFKAWSTNLSQAEIQQEMRQFCPVRTANLYSFTPFVDASTGTDFLDYSGNGRNWTEEGTISFEANPPISWSRSKSRIFIPTAGAAVIGPMPTFFWI